MKMMTMMMITIVNLIPIAHNHGIQISNNNNNNNKHSNKNNNKNNN